MIHFSPHPIGSVVVLPFKLFSHRFYDDKIGFPKTGSQLIRLSNNKYDFFIHIFDNVLFDQIKLKTSREMVMTSGANTRKELKKVGIYTSSSYYIRG